MNCWLLIWHCQYVILFNILSSSVTYWSLGFFKNKKKETKNKISQINTLNQWQLQEWESWFQKHGWRLHYWKSPDLSKNKFYFHKKKLFSEKHIDLFLDQSLSENFRKLTRSHLFFAIFDSNLLKFYSFDIWHLICQIVCCVCNFCFQGNKIFREISSLLLLH